MDKNKITNCSDEQSLLLLTETLRRLFKDFHLQLLSDIRIILADTQTPQYKTWIKSKEVKKLLGISHGTRQTMQNNGTITFTKIGGVIYYSRDDVEKMLNGKQNSKL